MRHTSGLDREAKQMRAEVQLERLSQMFCGLSARKTPGELCS